MTTFKYKGYESFENGTRVSLYWTDMHIEDIRADKIIKSREDLKDVVDRYEADRTQFDVSNYDRGYDFRKAARDYDVFISAKRDFHIITFEYGGKTYKTRTRKYVSLKMRISKAGGVIKRHETEQVQCLVSDATDEVIAEEKVIRTLVTYDMNAVALY